MIAFDFCPALCLVRFRDPLTLSRYNTKLRYNRQSGSGTEWQESRVCDSKNERFIVLVEWNVL